MKLITNHHKMLLDDYQKEKLTVNIVWANIFGLLILIPVALIYGIPYYLLWNNEFATFSFWKIIHNPAASNLVSYPMILVYILVGIIFHELIHGLTWSLFSKNGLKSIKYGIMWKMLTPYCHCEEPLIIKHYIIGAIMPAIILGILPAIIAIAKGHLGLLVFGMFFTLVASGDFLIINLLRKECMTDFVQDHPSEAGVYIYRAKKLK